MEKIYITEEDLREIRINLNILINLYEQRIEDIEKLKCKKLDEAKKRYKKWIKETKKLIKKLQGL